MAKDNKMYLDFDLDVQDAVAKVELSTEDRIIAKFDAVMAIFVSANGEYVLTNKNNTFSYGIYTDKSALNALAAETSKYDVGGTDPLDMDDEDYEEE